MYSKWFMLVAAAGLLPAMHGCGGSASGVSGSVAFEGQPVANGAISFLPEDGKGPVVGGPITAGRYRIDNITPGRKIVQIAGEKKGNVFHSREEIVQAAKTRPQRSGAGKSTEQADEIPRNAEGNNTVVEVQPGHTELNFTLKRPAVR